MNRWYHGPEEDITSRAIVVSLETGCVGGVHGPRHSWWGRDNLSQADIVLTKGKSMTVQYFSVPNFGSCFKICNNREPLGGMSSVSSRTKRFQNNNSQTSTGFLLSDNKNAEREKRTKTFGVMYIVSVFAHLTFMGPVLFSRHAWRTVLTHTPFSSKSTTTVSWTSADSSLLSSSSDFWRRTAHTIQWHADSLSYQLCAVAISGTFSQSSTSPTLVVTLFRSSLFSIPDGGLEMSSEAARVGIDCWSTKTVSGSLIFAERTRKHWQRG